MVKINKVREYLPSSSKNSNVFFCMKFSLWSFFNFIYKYNLVYLNLFTVPRNYGKVWLEGNLLSKIYHLMPTFISFIQKIQLNKKVKYIHHSFLLYQTLEKEENTLFTSAFVSFLLTLSIKINTKSKIYYFMFILYQIGLYEKVKFSIYARNNKQFRQILNIWHKFDFHITQAAVRFDFCSNRTGDVRTDV